MGTMEKVNAALLKSKVKSRLNKATAMGKHTNHSPMRLNVSLGWLASGINTLLPPILTIHSRCAGAIKGSSQLLPQGRDVVLGFGANGLFEFCIA